MCTAKPEPATRITMLGAPLARNLGGPSLLLSTITALDSVFPNAAYTLLVPSKGYPSDKALGVKYGVEVVPFSVTRWSLPTAILRRFTRCWIARGDERAMMEAFEQSDVVIDIWGIVFTDALGHNSFKGRLSEGLRFLIPKILGKPVIKYTADIGPFTQRWNRFFARFYLENCVDLILARDATTKRAVRELGVSTPIRQTPDTAFLLQPRKSEVSARLAQIRREKPVACISVTFMARRHASSSEHYVTCMTALAKHLINRHGAHVILLPNQVSRVGKDDTDEAREIHAKVAHSSCEVIEIEDLVAQEIKGIIQESDIAIAARYHTIVAALSMGIPTLAIGWHHKYRGVLSLYGQEQWVCEMGTLSAEDLTTKFEALWSRREEISKTLLRQKPEVERSIYAGAERVLELLQARRATKSE